jgi:putative flippase GtrA
VGFTPSKAYCPTFADHATTPAQKAAQDDMLPLSAPQLVAEMKRACRFFAVGACGLAMDTTVFMALHQQGAPRPAARAMSILCASMVTWMANRAFTFQASGRSRKAEFGRYGLVVLGAQGFNFILFLSLSAMAPEVHPLPLILVSAASGAVFSYTGQRFFTFGVAPAQST